MTHIPEHGCPKCRINGGFVASAADLYATLTHSETAIELANVAAAAQAIDQHAIAVGLITTPEYRGAWSGCAEAEEIMTWVNEVLVSPPPLTRTITDARDAKMREWTRQFASVALEIVSGNATEHVHAHTDDGDLLGGNE